MTKPLTPEEKARRKFWRSRSGRHILQSHPPRTKKETREFLAMIQRQGEEAQARGERIAAAYAADEVRQDEENTHARRMPRAGVMTIWKRLRNGPAGASTREGLAPPLSFPGATLAEKIGEKTRAFYALQGRPQGWDGAWRSDDGPPDLPPDFEWVAENPRRRWWQFWKPPLVRMPRR